MTQKNVVATATGRATSQAAQQQSPSSHIFLCDSWQQQQQRRWTSSGGSSSGNNNAGPQPRRRFYKQVGVTEVPPPWENRAKMERKGTNANDGEEDSTSIDSPISAGVDGTQSASGVRHLPKIDQQNNNEAELELFRERLIPRCTTTSSGNRNSEGLAEPAQWYSVTLDGRTLRTPMGQILSVPSQTLAWAIAAEWDAQKTQIRPVQMPLMTLCCTTLDQTASHVEHDQNETLKFLPTDTVCAAVGMKRIGKRVSSCCSRVLVDYMYFLVLCRGQYNSFRPYLFFSRKFSSAVTTKKKTCYWADPTEDRVLYRHQESAWKELHKFIEQEFSQKPAMAMGAQEGMIMSKRDAVTGQRGLPHPPPLYEACVEWTRSLDAWHLTALNSVASETKSFLVAFATLHPSSPFSVTSTSGNEKDDALAKAIRAARVEEEFQIESWGLVRFFWLFMVESRRICVLLIVPSPSSLM